MDAGREVVVRGEPLQQIAEGRAVVLVERGEQVVAVFLSGTAYLLEPVVPGWRQVQGVVAAVLQVAAPLEQSVALELIDQRHQPAGQQPELPRQRLLGAAGVRGHCP